ncbi:GNAT family N-acetyltransferase [Actinopolymorpha cephalotaxi]|uniref:Ribosomal protein S18 acetylase RimI-like enzyme n=1 Tax=Actinopolymorpha cephalotaxi TaxID=504797 RepID=A0ABX2SBR4_9ACTN|nr:GNAT family N-acetyltransferase [Actinopolymorpha cephalotaxi]NYH87098.1 ribosomal protein S18 acetylase RimI-like enzyme [Actinopolymorpha cephalotaxi]
MPDDADELGEVHVRVWREAYQSLVSQEYLDQLDPRRSAERWRVLLSEAPDGRQVRLLGLYEQEIVGFVMVGPPRDDDPPTPRELQVINVLPAHHGTGLADRMLADALGDSPAYLWVMEGNERALAFYRRYGFAADGVTTRHESTGTTLLRMVRR